MNLRLAFLSLPALALSASVSGLHAQTSPNSCATLPQNATVDQSTGCMPLTFHPADGGPPFTVWVPATFTGPTRNGDTLATSIKTRTLDFGLMGFFADPDYGKGSNADVGVFVAYTGKYFGVEADGADTVHSTGGVRESYLVAGPRVQYRARHYTVYAKAQVGAGHFNGHAVMLNQSGHSFLVENYGAGLELGLSRHLKLRAVDANYQIWPSFPPNRLTPIHIGSGIVLSF